MSATSACLDLALHQQLLARVDAYYFVQAEARLGRTFPPPASSL